MRFLVFGVIRLFFYGVRVLVIFKFMRFWGVKVKLRKFD